jgi:alkaline phosphatase D
MSKAIAVAFVAWCAVLTLGGASPAHAANTQVLSRIAFGSCAHQGMVKGLSQAIWKPIATSKPDLFLFLGDNIYADTYSAELKWAKYRQLAALPGYKALKKTCPILATWDDHDYGLNDSGAEFREKVSSQKLFLDFFETPSNSPLRRREGVYDARIFGPPGRRVQIILLDTRYFRSPLVRNPVKGPDEGKYIGNTDRTATLLGSAQWAWLAEQLSRPADVRLLISSIQTLAQDHGWERWMELPHERTKLFNLIRSAGAEGLLILSGDRHIAELSRMNNGPGGYPLYDLTSSGLTMSYPIQDETNRWRVGDMYTPCNFGLVDIDWSRPDPQITLQIRNVEGKTTITDTFPLSRLHRSSRKSHP